MSILSSVSALLGTLSLPARDARTPDTTFLPAVFQLVSALALGLWLARVRLARALPDA